VRRVADRLLIVGVGLIGGSLAMALRGRGAVGEIVGIGRSRRNMQVARQRGLVDRVETDAARAARGVDMAVVAVPVRAIAPMVAALAEHLPPEAVICDAGSVKGPVVAALTRALGATAGRFCGAHPIAGTEHSGAAAALPDLLAGQRCVLTPTEATARATVRRVRALWEAAGMQVDVMPVAMHDRIFALVSHLPHVAAFGLVNAVADAGSERRALAYAAGGFRDGTRVAASSPEMWTDIFLANRDPLLEAIDGFTAACTRLRDAIETHDRDTLETELARARAVRRRLAPPLARRPQARRAGRVRRGGRR
jgi:prephenate dehydrogenase